MKATTLVAVLLFAAAPLAAQVDVYVDAIGGDDVAGLGTLGAPYRTITRGVQQAGSIAGPNNVRVAPGRYDAALGESFPIQLPQQTNVLGSDARQTIVAGPGSGVLLALDERTLVSDLTVRGGDVGIESAGDCFGLGGTVRYVRRCIVTDCGVGIHAYDCLHSDHGLAVVNSVVHANGTGIVGESVDSDFQSVSVLLYGTTVTLNDFGLRAIGSGFERYLGMADSIVQGNVDDTISNWSSFLFFSGNVVGDAALAGSDGNVSVDPMFVAAALGDVHLRPAISPVVDSVAPAAPWPPAAQWIGSSGWSWDVAFDDVRDLDSNPRRVGPQIDPGADEVRLPTLWARGPAQLGTAFTFGVHAGAGEPVLVFASLGLLAAPQFGFVWLQAPWTQITTIVAGADGAGTAALPLPANPAQAGVDVYVQGVRVVLPAFTLDGTSPLRVRLLP